MPGQPLQLTDTYNGATKLLTSYEYLAGWLRAKFGETERGASLVEYALLLALIAVVCILAITALGKKASSKFDSIETSL